MKTETFVTKYTTFVTEKVADLNSLKSRTVPAGAHLELTKEMAVPMLRKKVIHSLESEELLAEAATVDQDAVAEFEAREKALELREKELAEKEAALAAAASSTKKTPPKKAPAKGK